MFLLDAGARLARFRSRSSRGPLQRARIVVPPGQRKPTRPEGAVNLLRSGLRPNRKMRLGLILRATSKSAAYAIHGFRESNLRTAARGTHGKARCLRRANLANEEVKNTMRTMLMLLVTAQLVQADSLTLRTDLARGREPSYTSGLVAPIGELWVFSTTTYPIVEAGRLHYQPLGKHASVLVGGYLSYWTVPHQVYVEPFSIWRAGLGKTNLYVKAAAYAPIGRGSWQTYGDTNISWPLTSRLSAGPAADWWLTEGTKPNFGLGGQFALKSKHATYTVRGLARPHSQELRLEVSLF